MKIVQINTTCGVGSTGKICVGISELLTKNQIENYIIYSSKSSGYALGIQCANEQYQQLQALKARIMGNYGFNSDTATKRMIAALERIRPDVVHLHNLHSHDCNLDLLLGYFRNRNTRLIWTFHDCWGFTGYCPHFAMMKCGKWRSGCHDCSQWREFSWFFDRSGELQQRKKQLLEGLNLTIVTPSQWLAGIVKQSFLRDAPVKVIHNGIDLSVFQPRKSDFRQRYGLETSKILLGVSFGWGSRKGLDVFVELSRRLPEEYQIILVGTNPTTDKLLPDRIISIHRTQNQQELAEIYTAADLFVNPTREENYPTVNMEALSCGTPVLTFRTGGSPEIIDETCGAVVPCDDVDALERQVRRICEDSPYSRESCLKKAGDFDQNERFKEYLKLYERVVSAGN